MKNIIRDNAGIMTTNTYYRFPLLNLAGESVDVDLVLHKHEVSWKEGSAIPADKSCPARDEALKAATAATRLSGLQQHDSEQCPSTIRNAGQEDPNRTHAAVIDRQAAASSNAAPGVRRSRAVPYITVRLAVQKLYLLRGIPASVIRLGLVRGRELYGETVSRESLEGDEDSEERFLEDDEPVFLKSAEESEGGDNEEVDVQYRLCAAHLTFDEYMVRCENRLAYDLGEDDALENIREDERMYVACYIFSGACRASSSPRSYA